MKGQCPEMEPWETHRRDGSHSGPVTRAAKRRCVLWTTPAETTLHVCVQHLNDRRVHATPDIQMLGLSEAQRLWPEAVRWRVKGLVFAGRGGYDNTDPLREIFFSP